MATTLPNQKIPQLLKDHPEFFSLSLRQQRFLTEYLNNPNATDAALKAGYSKRTAAKIGSENLQKLERFLAPVAKVIVAPKLMAAEQVVDRLQMIANASLDQFMEWDPDQRTIKIKPVEEIPVELRRCIKSITQHETQHVRYLKLELHSPVAALGMLAKYHNLFKRTLASKGLVVEIVRPANAPVSQQEQAQKPNGHAKPMVPQIEFIRPPGVKTASTTGAGTTNGKGSVSQHGVNNGHA